MKILLIDESWAFLAFALKCQEAGHDVRWFQSPRPDGTRSMVGDGWFKKVPDWEDHMDWADLIVLSYNTKYMRALEKYRRDGYPVFGSNMEGTEWELDRVAGAQVLKDAGANEIPSVEFTSFDKAIAYVKENPKRYVCKANGQNDRSLSYVSKSARDMVFMLEHWKRKQTKTYSFILQEFISGIEMAVGGWMGRDGWVGNWVHNWEFKKLMNDEKGFATGEMGCYDAHTEVLTRFGWKYWPEVTEEDELATLVDNQLVYEVPSALVEYEVDTDMVSWCNQSVDLLVTPNHNMYVQKQHAARNNLDEYQFIQAADCLESQYSVKRTAEWVGSSPKALILESSMLKMVVPFEDICRVLGIYFADGSTGGCQVKIADSHESKCSKILALLSSTVFMPKIKRHNHGLTINCTPLARLTEPFGRSYEKRIPQYIKDATKEHIGLFLEGFILGDGNVQTNGSIVLYTSNKLLADDLQELLLKVGKLGIIKEMPPRTRKCFIDGREIVERRTAYQVFVRSKKIRSWLDLRDKKIEHYTGVVYCATVSSHVLYVRRNGKPIWCGNTVIHCPEESKLADTVLKPLTPQLIRSGYTGYIDVNCLIDDKGEAWPMEFTSRRGWPLDQFMLAMHDNTDPAYWMLSALQGRNELNQTDQVCVGVLLVQPGPPYGPYKPDMCQDFPIWGTRKVRTHKYIHLIEAKLGMGIDDKLNPCEMPVSAYAEVAGVTGLGKTVSEAQEAAYKNVSSLEIPNSIMYRTDIGDRLKDQLPILRSLGYTDIKF